MSIATYDRLLAPFDDDKMNYLTEYHRYELLPEMADFQTGLNLSELWEGNDNVLWYLSAISEVTYTILERLKDAKYRERFQYYLSHSNKNREAIFKIMVDTIQYNFEDGGFLIAYQTGINLHEMKEIRMKIENAVSVIADGIIEKYGLKERFIKWNFNEFTYYATLLELVNYLVAQSYITQTVADLITTVDEIPQDYRYRTFLLEDGRYVYENMLTWKTTILGYGVDW